MIRKPTCHKEKIEATEERPATNPVERWNRITQS